MGRLSYKTLLLCLGMSLTGCSVAVPEVVSLLSNFSLFKLTEEEIRIDNLSLLNSITVDATCSSQSTGFEYELVDANPGVWTSVPSSSGGIFTSVTNNCATSMSLQMVLNLSSESAFTSMTLGSYRRIRFRDQNTFNISTTDELRIAYSTTNLSMDRIVYGQGFNNTICSGAYCVRGRVVSISNDTSVSGAYQLSGKVVFQ